MKDTVEKLKLHEKLDQVEGRDSFFDFVRALIADRKNPVGWENDTIENFLEAALAEDTDMGESQGLTEDQLWKKFAVFLYCGKIYE
ncbi:MAG: hypothetical protein HY231_07625 [Acidobacteria bacterium]|nr:hypothetical protein [Acidobacteriota bacterium]